MITDIQLLGSATNQFFGDQNDISFDPSGNIVLINGTAYARQAIVKILLTVTGDNPLFPGYGSTVSSLVGNAINSPGFNSSVVNSITSALTYYNQTNINADPTQKISSINAINVSTNQNVVTIVINLTMQDGTQLSLPFTL